MCKLVDLVSIMGGEKIYNSTTNIFFCGGLCPQCTTSASAPLWRLCHALLLLSSDGHSFCFYSLFEITTSVQSANIYGHAE